jgi:uncharacterized membrane protein YhhN
MHWAQPVHKGVAAAVLAAMSVQQRQHCRHETTLIVAGTAFVPAFTMSHLFGSQRNPAPAAELVDWPLIQIN